MERPSLNDVVDVLQDSTWVELKPECGHEEHQVLKICRSLETGHWKATGHFLVKFVRKFQCKSLGAKGGVTGVGE